MQRDMELVIKVLEFLENRDEISVVEKLHIDGFDDRVVAYHLRRMFEAGLLDAESTNSKTTPDRIITVYPFGLSWEGHEFLDSMRNETVAAQVRQKLGSSLANVPFTIIRELALALGRTQVGL
ncbi:DUF2513 domain-containing protein [Marinobacter sp. CA1]|uniref:DUF2513 domain-containing protein n=1 Tax=Marinobacter sp. CA1 TaxID=2817656 RepID=UPI001D06732C|nr:DUF2513 domain-containing protein [Marinobacter sp. CA1]UDL04676.1 DUF2513 domain-containing protein [Marinobacter sp. CA1]